MTVNKEQGPSQTSLKKVKTKMTILLCLMKKYRVCVWVWYPARDVCTLRKSEGSDRFIGYGKVAGMSKRLLEKRCVVFSLGQFPMLVWSAVSLSPQGFNRSLKCLYRCCALGPGRKEVSTPYQVS